MSMSLKGKVLKGRGAGPCRCLGVWRSRPNTRSDKRTACRRQRTRGLCWADQLGQLTGRIRLHGRLRRRLGSVLHDDRRSSPRRTSTRPTTSTSPRLLHKIAVHTPWNPRRGVRPPTPARRTTSQPEASGRPRAPRSPAPATSDRHPPPPAKGARRRLKSRRTLKKALATCRRQIRTARSTPSLRTGAGKRSCGARNSRRATSTRFEAHR